MTTTEASRVESRDALRPLHELIDVAGLLCGLCDRAEHNEGVDIGALQMLGARLRDAGLAFLEEAGQEPVAAYRRRLGQMETKSVLHDEAIPLPAAELAGPVSWRQAQLVQVRHDREFHPDVTGMPKRQQLEHYALHLGKLVRHRWLADTAPEKWTDWAAGRIADPLIFGVKLATVVNERLPESPLQ